jgi:hypothetical protein
MKMAGWRLEDKGKRRGQATPQKVRQYKKKMQNLTQRLKTQGSATKKSGKSNPDFFYVAA